MNKPNECTEHTNKLLHLYLKSRKSHFNVNDSDCIELLIQNGVLIKLDKEGLYKFNFDSTLLGDVLYDFIEKETNQKFTKDIKQSFQLIKAFEENKKVEYNYSNIINAYSELIDGFKSYILCHFHSKNEIDIVQYFTTLNKKERKKIETYYLHALIFIEIPIEKLLAQLIADGDETRHEIIKYCKELCKFNQEKAKALYDFVINKKYEDCYFYTIAYLFLGLYEVDRFFYTRKNELFQNNTRLGYFVLGRLKLISKEEIIDCFNYIEKVQNNDEALLEVPYLYKSLIENENTSVNIRELCFRKLEHLFLSENENLKNEIFQICSWIKGYEKKKYNLLINTFLSKSQNYYDQISHYFIEFEDPQYFFHLFGNLCLISHRNKNRFSAKIFQEAFSQFWRKNNETTSKELLKSLTQDNPYIRLGAVELIRTLNQQELSNLDLLALKSEIFQLRALEALIFSSYYHIEVILGLILSLEKSPYPKVIEYLQKKLSELIFYSYHDFLFEKIENATRSKEFIAPLAEALNSYHRMCDFKAEINDLNPSENEKEFMNMYYRLEAEANRKIFKDADKGIFLDFAKETIIVRGNAWKIGDNEVSPLGKFESTMSLDLNMYKNPDLFDFQKNNFKSKY